MISPANESVDQKPSICRILQKFNSAEMRGMEGILNLAMLLLCKETAYFTIFKKQPVSSNRDINSAACTLHKYFPLSQIQTSSSEILWFSKEPRKKCLPKK